MGTINFTQKPNIAISYIKKKYPKLSFHYDEILHETHHKAFTVAKVTRLDLLSDIQNSLTKARDRGQPFEQWKKELIPTLKAKGWWGTTTVTNPKTKEDKEIYVGSRRLRTIFYTNTRVSYNVGRWQHQEQLLDAPYLRYVAILDENIRPTHKILHGIIRHRDDEFWHTNYPPNGWNCRCRVQAYSMASIKRRGWEDKLKAPATNIADKDWAYDVRKGTLAKVEDYREQRVSKAPTNIRSKAKQELELDKLYQMSYSLAPTTLQTYLLKNRPSQKIDKALKLEAGYQISTQTILHSTKNTAISTVQHELGHHIDNINKFWSINNIDKLLKKDVALWTNATKKEIMTLLSDKKNLNVGLHDLFYMNSNRKFGEKTREDNTKFTRELVSKESFANIFEILLSKDNRVDILRLYFPTTLKAVEKMIKELK